MPQGTHRYVSRTNERHRPNPFFVALSDKFFDALVDGSDTSDEELADFYVSSRISDLSDESRTALVERMPEDIQRFSNRDETSSFVLDDYELDLIDFLLHCHKNRVLSIVGSVGIGKSTFLRYVLRSIRRECPSLQQFVPVMLNCLAVGDDEPTLQDFVYALRDSFKQIIQEEYSSETERQAKWNELDELLDPLDINAIGVGSSVFIDLVRRFDGLLGADKHPIVVFDNVDQLSPTHVAKISALSRSLFLRAGIAVIMAMRPATYSTHLENGAHKGAFYHFMIELRPPDLREIMIRRLTYALKSHKVRIEGKGYFSLEIKDVRKSVQALTEKVLTSENQSYYLRGICNNNLRRALAGFTYFLRYRDLSYELLFSVDSKSTGHKATESATNDHIKGTWSEHLLDGLMIGDWDYYADGHESPVCNVLVFDPPEHSPNFTILYRCLSLLAWAGKMVEKRHFRKWLRGCGYHPTLVDAALNHLLGRSLIYSPDHEKNIQYVRHLCISSAGRFYLDRLVDNRQYIFNVIYDVPLPHALWNGYIARDYHVRLNSLYELIQHTLEIEREELKMILTGESVAENLGSTLVHGFLTRRLHTAATSLIEGGKRSQLAHVRDTARDLEQAMDVVERELDVAERALLEGLTSRQLLPPHDRLTEQLSIPIGDESCVSLQVPEMLNPAGINEVDVEIEMKQLTHCQSVYVYLTASSEGVTFEEIKELSRSSKPECYSGNIVISDISRKTRFPTTRLTVFADSKPVLSRHFSL